MHEVDRRQALAAMGSVGLAGFLAACGGDDEGPSRPDGGAGRSATSTERFDAASRCQVTAEQTEGPYYFDVDSIRRDIREGRPGRTLTLGLRVREAGSCEPIENAVVDVWHCDAGGLYSGFEAASTGGPGGGGRSDDETYLRGAQATNADGVARFTTIYPGWYQGRTPHIHVKVHLDRRTALTTQVYFPDSYSDRVYRERAYATRGGRDQTNASDGIFDGSLVLDLSRDGDAVVGLKTLDVRRS